MFMEDNSVSEHIEADGEVVQQLAETASVMTAMLERMTETHEVQTNDLEYFRDDLGLVRNAIQRIARVLHEGNGDKPLITRVAILEEKTTQIEVAVERLGIQIDDREKAEQEDHRIGLRGKYAVATALISAVAALAVAVVSLLS